MFNPMRSRQGSLLSIARSHHLVVLVNSVIPFLDVGIRQEPHVLFGNDPARFVHRVDQSGVHPRQLKIAALHDIHQSLAVTIQFTGRSTRTNPMVGPATSSPCMWAAFLEPACS